MPELSKKNWIMLFVVLTAISIPTFLGARGFARIEVAEAQRGYLMALKKQIQIASAAEEISKSGNDVALYLAPYFKDKDETLGTRLKENLSELPKRKKELTELIGTLPTNETIKVSELSTVIVKSAKEIQSAVDSPKDGLAEDKQRQLFKDLRSNSDELRKEVQAIRAKEMTLLDSMANVKLKSGATMLGLVFLGLLNAVTSCIAFWMVGVRVASHDPTPSTASTATENVESADNN
ncbi:MAG TPA: hypothetical protein EYN91_16085 [Candidatus Melainabacteria bacterium]|jgi:hypothetical protein|nr:hypothetical protein [Candidatus Melainabacteria bacterium]HIN63315.1 hypothetical protein [Candidatus Obscuribacterales bacterium]